MEMILWNDKAETLESGSKEDLKRKNYNNLEDWKA
jgi:hypothetical protein